MANIGTFTTKDGKITGKIQTLTLNASLVFLPNENQSGPDAPAYRAYVGRCEVGAAWEKTSDGGRTYLSARLDDPSFPSPVFANLIEQEDGTHALLWSRPRN